MVYYPRALEMMIPHQLVPGKVLLVLGAREFLARDNYIITRSRLADRMVLGSYPEVWQLQDRREQITYLKELAADYLLKDILQYDGIRNAMKI